MRCALFVAAIGLLPSAAIAASFSAPLPGLVGAVDFPTSSGRQASFDFGQEFSDITDVWIEIEAHVFAQEFDVCGTVFNPQPCVHEVQLLGFFARIDKEDSPTPGSIISEGLSFSDDFHALEGSGTDVASFDERLIGWNFLLDGDGSLILFWNGAFELPGRIIQNTVQPSGEILSARLIVEGTPVPEPSTALMIAAGLVVLATRRSRK